MALTSLGLQRISEAKLKCDTQADRCSFLVLLLKGDDGLRCMSLYPIAEQLLELQNLPCLEYWPSPRFHGTSATTRWKIRHKTACGRVIFGTL